MSLIQKLESKIESLIQSYNEQTQELESLRAQIATLQAESAQKDLQISALYEEIGNRDRSLESLYDKISNALDSNKHETHNE